jgi:hypothetical protein
MQSVRSQEIGFKMRFSPWAATQTSKGSNQRHSAGNLLSHIFIPTQTRQADELT